ncbi:MAG: hypothetical protein H6718_25690 [Polyangiaceae bacterium]|nr:hypothetical protein [Myxococcales bacterium]MCB9588830.1 hypothetical protein [Polyangiaceae bacterium]MCB9605389.1 hypothetical protein [Polyangiaceae bacterium]
MSDYTDYDHAGLKISVLKEREGVRVSWRGVSDTRDPSLILWPFLSELVGQLKGATVVLDFRDFEYMNSATVSPLIRFVKELDGVGAKSTLLFDVAQQWQRVNAQCMRSIARTLNDVTVP